MAIKGTGYQVILKYESVMAIYEILKLHEQNKLQMLSSECITGIKEIKKSIEKESYLKIVKL